MVVRKGRWRHDLSILDRQGFMTSGSGLETLQPYDFVVMMCDIPSVPST